MRTITPEVDEHYVRELPPELVHCRWEVDKQYPSTRAVFDHRTLARVMQNIARGEPVYAGIADGASNRVVDRALQILKRWELVRFDKIARCWMLRHYPVD